MSKSAISAVVLLTLILAIPVFGQEKMAMRPEDVVGLRRASDVQITADGRRVLFVLTVANRERDRYDSDIWMVNEARETIRLTSNTMRDDHPRWSPDGARIAFLSERGSGEGHDHSAQIYLLNARIGGEPQRLTNHGLSPGSAGEASGVAGVPIERFIWSADGRYIIFLAAVPHEQASTRLPIVVDGEESVSPPSQLWSLEVATGRVRQLTTGSRHILDFDLALDGQRIIFTARPTPRLLDSLATEIYLISADQGGGVAGAAIDTSGARQLTHGNGVESEPRFSPDGRWMSYLAKADGDPLAGPDRIHLIPPGSDHPIVLAKGAKPFDGHIRSHRWAWDNSQIVFSAGIGVTQQICSIEIDGESPQVLTRTDGFNSSFSITPDGQSIAFIHENPRLASEVALLSARNMIPVFLTELNPQSSRFSLGQVETIHWRAKDGATIEGLLYYPVGYETGVRYPLVTALHGGPESAATKSFQADWNTFPQLYTARGFVVFLPNFRGSSNYGSKFAQANARLAGKIDLEDVLSGIDHLVKSGVADDERLGVVGWSYGGYLSGMLIGHTTRFRAAAYGAGLSNAVSWWGTAEPIVQRERLHGGTPWESGRLYESQSPITNFSRVRTPTLIFHGERDERVPLSQSRESYRRLRRLGVNVQMVIYPGQGHTIDLPSYQIDKMKRELEWMERFLDPARVGK